VVEQLLRLKLRLFGNAFRRSPWQIFGLVVGLVYGVGLSLAVVTVLIGLRHASVPGAAGPVTVFGALLVVGFIVVPLVIGVDDVLDPRKFSLFGIPTSRLTFALSISALVSIPALVVTLIALSQIFTWARGPLPVILAIVGAPLILATCLLCARVSTSIAAFVLADRRSRDAAGLLGIVLLFIVTLVFVLLFTTNWQRQGSSILRNVASVAAWTPFGAVWDAPAEAAAGHVGPALFKLLIAIVFVGALWFAWRELIKLTLVTQPRSAEARRYRGLGFFRFGRVTPASVIAERSFTYWIRDARYHASLIVIPIIPFVLMIPFLIIGTPAHILALFPVPVMALFLGWSIHNDTAYDNTAIWLHVASGTRGRDDRFGRVIPPLVVGVPVIVIAAIICAPLYSSFSLLPALLGVGLGLLLTGLGLSSVGSARFPYPAVRPGDSPFAAPQAVGSASPLIQSLSFIVTLILAGPTLVLAGYALTFGGMWSLLALISGIVFGILFLLLGVGWGGRIFDRRAPEILGASVRN
jgi:ABC-2 type transport system permease protein